MALDGPILTMRHGTVPDLPIGTRLRILPNHACATAAQFGEYDVLDGPGAWTRLNGW
ncbi:hypothetical protein [Actinosynnema sp. ALI-1.44]|uniref:hypothetical protein n=1 Tax=Actinosynnema sp. ALI-1.44 TaxID=1933779 RepID=UPI0009FF741A|nr:hypothetical protein [Actinosynnema sp. ALI-1.44]